MMDSATYHLAVLRLAAAIVRAAPAPVSTEDALLIYGRLLDRLKPSG